jgi:hypothetical protein
MLRVPVGSLTRSGLRAGEAAASSAMTRWRRNKGIANSAVNAATSGGTDLAEHSFVYRLNLSLIGLSVGLHFIHDEETVVKFCGPLRPLMFRSVLAHLY